jgi:nitrogen fixation NifU-like protein
MSNDGLDALYQDTILDHYKNPRGKHDVSRVDLEKYGYNPICGDKVLIRVQFNNDSIEDVSVESSGCAISVASGSMLAELLPGKNIEEVLGIAESFREMMLGNGIPEDVDFGDLDVLEGVSKYHSRVKCALLSWVTLKDLIGAWQTDIISSAPTTTEREV